MHKPQELGEGKLTSEYKYRWNPICGGKKKKSELDKDANHISPCAQQRHKFELVTLSVKQLSKSIYRFMYKLIYRISNVNHTKKTEYTHQQYTQ